MQKIMNTTRFALKIALSITLWGIVIALIWAMYNVITMILPLIAF